MSSGARLWPLIYAICVGTSVPAVLSLNIVWINDARNSIGEEVIGAVFDNAGSIFSGVTIDSISRVVATSNASTSIADLCPAIDEMVDAGTPPDMVLDSSFAGRTSDAIKSLTLTLGIPAVSLSYGDMDDLGEWENLNTEQQKYLIQMRPPGDTMTYVVRQMVSDQNITNAAIIFDEQFVMDYKYRSLLMNVPVRHLINRMKMGDAEIEKHLKRLSDVDLNNIFLFSSLENAKTYLDVANMIKMYGTKYSWFVLTKDPLVDFKCDCEDLSVMSMNTMSLETDKVQNLERLYGFDGIPKIDAAFYYDATVMALNAMNSWKQQNPDFVLDVPRCQDYTETTPVERTNLDLRSAINTFSNSYANHYGKIVALQNGENNEFNYGLRITDNKFTRGNLVRQEEVGTWNARTSDFQFRNGRSLDGIAATTVYRVSTVIQPPFVMRKNDSSGYEGYCIDLIDELKLLMGFEYEIYEAPDNQYGNMNENMEWNGVIRELVDKRADIALGALSVMAERENVVDFTVPYYDLVGITIMMRKPKAPTSLFKFLSVLEDSVWGCILAAYFITSLLMWIFDRWSPYSYQNNMEKYKDDDEKRYFNLKECLWFCMTSLTPQGGGEAPKNLSGRLVAATWWLFGFIIIASYTANLAAFLTVSRLETPVESLEDLSKQYKIQYSPMNGSSTMTYFERMAYIEEKFYEIWKDMSLNDSMSDLERSKLAVWDYPVSDKYTKMWQSMQEAGLPQTFEEAVERVRASPTSNEGYAFLGDATDIRYKVLTDCEFQMVGEEFSRKPYALAVQQGSPLKDQFNDAILKLLNQRKLETLKERWWNQNPNKVVCDDDDDSGGGISIYNIGGVFIVIFVGIGLAIVTLVFEYWYYKYKKPASRVDSGSKQFKVKQAMHGSTFGDNKNYDTEYRTKGSNIAPVGNPW